MRKIGFMLTLILLASFTSASGYWFEDYEGFGNNYKEKLSVTSVKVYYDNEDRHSTSSYRNGYTYRSTTEFFDRKRDLEILNYNWDYYDKCDGKEECRWYKKRKNRDCNWEKFKGDWRKLDRYERKYEDHLDRSLNYKYESSIKKNYNEYVSYLDEYQERECYVVPPKNKLFYVKC